MEKYIIQMAIKNCPQFLWSCSLKYKIAFYFYAFQSINHTPENIQKEKERE